jgi:membrane protein required for colicin V production
MNYLDIFVLIAIAYACWKGFKKGLVVEIFTLLALLFGLYAALHFSSWTSEKIQANVDEKLEHLSAISFTLTFLAVGAMVYFMGKAIEKLIDFVHLSLVNKFLGIVFSVIKMLYVLSVLFVLVESYDKHETFVTKDAKSASKFYMPLKSLSIKTIPYFEQTKLYLDSQYADSVANDDITDSIKPKDETKN